MASTGSSSSGAAPDSPSPAGAHVVVGILSYNDAETIGAVAGAVRGGLLCHAGGLTCRIACVDAGSTDGSVARARAALDGHDVLELATPPTTADLLGLPFHGIPGKARALHAVLATARDLRARVCIVIDGALRSVTPDWIEWLARPVLDHECDYVAAHYQRRAHEGALTRGLVYPAFRALYGVQLHQPAGSEFACSARLVEHFLHDELWDRDGVQVGVDLWLAASAASGDFRLAEAELGTRAAHTRGEEALDLATTVTQVVGALFADLEYRAERWQRTRGAVPIQRFGVATPALPAPLGVDPEPMVESFRLGYRELRDIWTWVLPPRTILDLRRLADSPPATFRMEDELWATIVYDFAIGYRLRVLPRDHLLRSLVPLYLGWFASFLNQVRHLDGAAIDERVEALAAAFERQKAYLIARWRWPERIRT